MFMNPDASVETVSLAVTSTSDTQTFTYPSGRSAASYGVNGDHKITGRDFSELSSRLGHITITFGPSNITVVNNGDRTFKSGTTLNLILDLAGYDQNDDGVASGVDAVDIFPVQIYLGAPVTADPNGYVASQNLTSAGVFSVDATAAGALAAAALAGSADIPRNVVAAWTGTATLTITGTDSEGNVVVEASASGTSLAGKKAFATVTDISSSANITGLTVGTGDVLGIPLFVESGVHVVGEIQDGAAATAGTVVGGATATATATTGDVRGTYDPNAAANGARVFELLAMVKSRAYLGVAQFAG